MSKRKAVPLEVKVAAALLMLKDEHGERLIPHEHAKLMSAGQILSLFHWDHYPVRHEDGGPDEPWNLTPRFAEAHREKTAKVDAPEAAKGRHLRKKEAEHRFAMGLKLIADAMGDAIADAKERPRRRSKIPSRPFDKRPRPFRRSDFKMSRTLAARGAVVKVID